ncbi:hypothetical protein B0H66DRAFT_538706 [Apodospora peruviana]|uniref:Uncharacterized protein n=1 Tax=Apodospora peruviana TaxID=516989 RepID=A0AAE0HT51_9PEZI|nr:hypothetical protein B0H66DRAFT_538706 [Apodospora peruviana]
MQLNAHLQGPQWSRQQSTTRTTKKMVRLYLTISALTLAHTAAALLDGHIDVNVVANVLAQATTTNEGLLACATADAILNSCYSAGSLEPTLPTATIANCLCCYQDVELDVVYLACASYVYYTEPTAVDAFSTASSLYEICDAAGTCRAPGGAAQPTPPPAPPPPPPPEDPTTTIPPVVETPPAPPPDTTPGLVSVPPVCNSLVDFYNGCSSAIPGFSTAPVGELASCFCYDGSGSYNTDIQDLADGCAPWAKTADPSDYTLIEVLQTFCDVYGAAAAEPTPTTTSKLTLTNGGGGTTRTTADSGSGGGGNAAPFGSFAFGNGGTGGGGSSPTPTPTSSDSSPSAVVTITKTAASGSDGNLGAGAPRGVIVWLGNAFVVALGYFMI